MINISEKSKCCGCSACAQRCPKHCITMQSDEEGFLYPIVNTKECIDCRLCERVCPVLNQDEPRTPEKCIAAQGTNLEVVRTSSSAGVFTLLAEGVIKKGGVVFGAAFNANWDVEHTYAETIDDLFQFRSSKYVQSKIGSSYNDAERFLKIGREVLFSGTPCQIAGLKKYLRRDYDDLIAVDVICHGTPSPSVWRAYLRSILDKNYSTEPLTSEEASRITHVSFRDKHIAWNKYCLKIEGWAKVGVNKTLVNQKHYYNTYIKAFLHNYMLRLSCYECPARKGKSGSDLLLGDFWGIARKYPEFFSSEGVSMVLAYTEKGNALLNQLDIEKINISYSDTTSGNTNIEFDEKKTESRHSFFEDFRKDGVKVLLKYNKMDEKIVVLVFLKNVLDKLKTIIK